VKVRTLTYVLEAPGVDERVLTEVDELIADVRERSGIPLRYAGMEDADDSLVYIWSSAEVANEVAGEAIRLVHDVRFDYAYVEVDFDQTKADAELLDRTVRTKLRIADAGELLSHAKNELSGRALIRAAVANRGVESAEMIRLVEAALGSESPDVKEAAVLSLTALAWTSLLPVIKRAISRENDERVRAALEYMEQVLSGLSAGAK
jgi:hypothetical protein